MLTMVEREMVDKYHYLTHDEFADIVAIAESTPGAIAINIATFIGTKQVGILGGIFATLGVVLPSFLIILGISLVIDLVRENVWVGYLFRGIRVGVLVLIAKSVLTFWRGMKKNILNILIAIVAFLIVFLTNVSVIYVLLATIGLFTLLVIFKNLRIKKLGIITDVDAYQKKVVEQAELDKAATTLNLEKDMPNKPCCDCNSSSNTDNDNFNCPICDNGPTKYDNENNEEDKK